MKVRQDGTIYEQVGEWKHPCGAYFRVLETAHEFKLVPLGGVFDTCEEIKDEPTWQDVTGDIAVDNWCALYNTKMGAVVFGTSNPTHRLRKVPVIMQNDSKHDGDAFDTTVRMAFVVERKVSE